jgi:acyl dehydratase
MAAACPNVWTREQPMTEAAKTQDGWAMTVNGMPTIGSAAERTRRVTMNDVVAFTGMTGDNNPLHYDAGLAEQTVFGKLIVQGGVTSGILNAIVAEDLPGPGTVFLGVEWKFVKAVGVDEEITGRVEVTKCRGDKPICTLETTVRNAAGEVCLSGTATTFTVPLKGLRGAPSA